MVLKGLDMQNAPNMATARPISNEELKALIEVGEAHAAGQPVSNAEAVFYLFLTPALLQELLDRRHAQAGVEWMARPTNVVELAARRTGLKLVQPEGAA